jgi:hypothetical protein
MNLNYFSIGIISLPLETLEMMVVSTIQIKRTTKTIDARVEPSCNFRSSAKIALNNKLEVNLEDKVYLETYYHHTSSQMQVDETLAKV